MDNKDFLENEERDNEIVEKAAKKIEEGLNNGTFNIEMQDVSDAGDVGTLSGATTLDSGESMVSNSSISSSASDVSSSGDSTNAGGLPSSSGVGGDNTPSNKQDVPSEKTIDSNGGNSKSSDKSNSSDGLNDDTKNENNSDSSDKEQDKESKSNDKSDGALNQLKDMTKDNKSSDAKKNPPLENKPEALNPNKKGNLPNNNNDKNNKNNNNNLNKNPISDKLKNNPAVDNAKKELDKAKEQGKKAAAKAAGAAGASIGIPPKVGEFVSKKALDKADKIASKKLEEVKGKVQQRASELQEKTKNSPLGGAAGGLGGNKEGGKNVVGKAKEAMQAIKVMLFLKKFGWLILVVVLFLSAIALYATVISTIQDYVPGLNGDVKEEKEDEDEVKYSKRDEKILTSIAEVVDKYPSVTAEEASEILTTVAYPYHDMLQNDNVKVITGKMKKDSDEEEEDDDEDTSELLFEDDDANDSDDDDDDSIVNNDIYLTLFKKSEYINKFDELMEKYSEDSSEDKSSYKDYLENTYYKEDKGYKKMFKDLEDEETEEELKKELEKDITANADMYLNYIPVAKCATTSTQTSLGTYDAGQIFSSPIYVMLKDYSASGGTFKVDDFYSAPAQYGTDTDPIPLKRYIMGVVYAEHTTCATVESCAKTLMIAAKSYAIGRQKSQGYKTEYAEDKTILHLRGNSYDQDFCDVYEGCNSGKYSKHTTKTNNANYKDAMPQNQIENLEQWYDETADQYLMNSDNEFVGSYRKDNDKECKVGECLSQDKIYDASKKEKNYLNILFNADKGGYDDGSHTLYNASDSSVSSTRTGKSIDCPSSSCGVSGDRDGVVAFAREMVNKIVYYYAGKPSGPNYEDNNFGSKVAPDHRGRTVRGLDCSGFVDFVFWHVMGENFGLGNTSEIRDVYSDKISYDELMPGDVGFLDMKGSGTAQHVGIYAGKDDKGKDVWIDCNASNGVQEHNTSIFKVYFRPKVFTNGDNSVTNTCDTGGDESRVCKKYDLSDTDLKKIAYIAEHEQGSAEGARAEASLIANKYEISKSKKSLFNYVNESSWWASGSKGGSSNNKKVIEAVKDALVNGHRSFPSYIDEHDCIYCGNGRYDVVKLKLNGKTYTDSKNLLDHKNYVKDKTVIYNHPSYGSVYTFYSFPTEKSDPFGYTKKRKDTCESTGETGVVTTKKGDIAGKKFYAPIQKKMTMYGKDAANGYTNHDLGADCGTPVYAPASGTATFTTTLKNGKIASYGNSITINTTDGYKIILAHLEKLDGIKLKYGHAKTGISCSSGGCTTHKYAERAVKQGEHLGTSGNSGNTRGSTGCHLHVEIWKGSKRLEPSTLLGYN